MDGIHPKFVLSKRFPVHAAVEQLNLEELEKLLTPASDARFHFGRKLNGTDISILHQACATKMVERSWEKFAVREVIRVLLELGAPHTDIDQAGQTPLFYAVSHQLAEDIVPILLRAGANPNVQRKADQWSPLFICAMLGRTQVANILLQSGADPDLEDEDGRTAEDVAKEFRHFSTADIISSPRRRYRPEFPSEWSDLLISSLKDDCIILWDEHIEWRAKNGVTLLHIASWTGNLNLFNAFCNDVKGRNLLSLSTTEGLTPLSLAIINGQTAIIEAYFQHRIAKKSIYLQSDIIKDSCLTIPHLLFQFSPLTHPKCLLKRKDLTSGIVNAVDKKGNTPLVQCALRNSRDTVRRLLSSKAANERSLFDLSLQNQYGKNVLHYLVINNDKHNVVLTLNLLARNLRSTQLLNALDVNDLNPIMYCLKLGNNDIAKAIFNHPIAKDLLDLSVRDRNGKTILHLAAERGNTVFWNLLFSRPDIDPVTRDEDGNTALMTAALAGKPDIIISWLQQVNQAPDTKILLSVQNQAGLNLFMLVVKHMEESVSIKFIDSLDLSVCIDQKDKQGMNVLLLLCSLEKWNLVLHLLKNSKLDDIVMDIHPTDKTGSSSLVLALIAKSTAERQLANFKLKHDSIGERGSRRQVERQESIVELLLKKERDLHGTSITTGRDTGIKCIREQLECNRKIRTPVPEEIIQEFTNLYSVVFRPKKKPAPPPEIPIQKPVKKTELSTFQQRMNDIYKEAQKNGKEKDVIMEGLKLERAPEKVSKPEKPCFDDIEYEYDEPTKDSRTEKPKTNGQTAKPEIPEIETKSDENEPSVAEIRAMWKQNRKQETLEERKDEDFSSSDFFDSLLKKHEMNGITEKPLEIEGSEDTELAERMNEEILWALQQKREAEQLANPKPEEEKPQTKLSEPISKPGKQEPDKVEAKKEEIKKDSMNFLSLIKPPKKLDAKALKEQEEREIKELENAINEEIKWAQDEKKRLEEERNKRLSGMNFKEPETPVLNSRNEEEEKKAEEERKRKISVERDRMERIQREAEEMIRKVKEEQNLTKLKEPEIKAQPDIEDKIHGSDKTNQESSLLSKSISESKKEDKGKEKREDKKVEKKEEKKEEKFSQITLKSRRDDAANKPLTIQERIEQQKKKEEERIKRFQEEKEKMLNLQNAVESKISSMKTDPEKTPSPSLSKKTESPILNGNDRKKSINGIEIIENGNENGIKIPKWKLDKAKQSKSVDTPESPENTAGERKTSLDLSPTDSPTLMDPELKKVPRWKREKLLRDRKLSVEKSDSVSPVDSSPSPTLPTLKITTPPRIPQKAQELSSPEPSPPQPIAPLPESPGLVPVTPPRKSPSPQPLQTSEKMEEAPGPAPVRRRRKTLDTEDQQQYGGQQSRPARRSKIEETIAEVVDGADWRSVGVGVDARPGYKDASTQTDPVPTVDMAV